MHYFFFCFMMNLLPLPPSLSESCEGHHFDLNLSHDIPASVKSLSNPALHSNPSLNDPLALSASARVHLVEKKKSNGFVLSFSRGSFTPTDTHCLAFVIILKMTLAVPFLPRVRHLDGCFGSSWGQKFSPIPFYGSLRQLGNRSHVFSTGNVRTMAPVTGVS